MDKHLLRFAIAIGNSGKWHPIVGQRAIWPSGQVVRWAGSQGGNWVHEETLSEDVAGLANGPFPDLSDPATLWTFFGVEVGPTQLIKTSLGGPVPHGAHGAIWDFPSAYLFNGQKSLRMDVALAKGWLAKNGVPIPHDEPSDCAGCAELVGAAEYDQREKGDEEYSPSVWHTECTHTCEAKHGQSNKTDLHTSALHELERKIRELALTEPISPQHPAIPLLGDLYSRWAVSFWSLLHFADNLQMKKAILRLIGVSPNIPSAVFLKNLEEMIMSTQWDIQLTGLEVARDAQCMLAIPWIQEYVQWDDKSNNYDLACQVLAYLRIRDFRI